MLATLTPKANHGRMERKGPVPLLDRVTALGPISREMEKTTRYKELDVIITYYPQSG